MMYTRRNRHSTSLMLTSDVERTALGQPDAWQQEHGESCLLQLTSSARRPPMALSPCEQASGAVMTQLHGNERYEQREITPDLHLPSFLSGEESQHLLPWEIIFRDHQVHWRRSCREALCEQSTQQQVRLQSLELASLPRDLIAEEWYGEQNLTSVENAQEISTGEESGR